MADHDKNLEFGVSVVPLAEPPEFALRVTLAAEEAGLDLRLDAGTLNRARPLLP